MKQEIKIVEVHIEQLKPADYNPRKWDEKAIKDLTASITEFGMVDPIIVNGAENRKNIVIGGHFRLKIAKDLGYKEVPVVYVNITDEKKEQELNLRLNKNQGTFDYDLLKNMDIELLKDIGFENWELGVYNGEKIDIKEEWVGMPDFNQESMERYKTLYVHFEKKEDFEKFAELIAQKLTDKTKYIWFPEQYFNSHNKGKAYTSEQ